MYSVVFTRKAQKDLKNLSEEEKQRIAGKLREYAHNPEQYARKLVNPKIGTYRFGMGDYRVIFDIEDNQLVILRMGHRRDIYRNIQ